MPEVPLLKLPQLHLGQVQCGQAMLSPSLLTFTGYNQFVLGVMVSFRPVLTFWALNCNQVVPVSVGFVLPTGVLSPTEKRVRPGEGQQSPG